MRRTPRLLLLLLLLLVGVLPALPAAAYARIATLSYQSGQPGGVQRFLDGQPGPLKSYRDGDETAATIIEDNSLYYGLSPRLHLALLEATNALISDSAPPPAALQRPYGRAGPTGFAAQVEWASRELRAGLGPYERPPVVFFSDGLSRTLTLDQAPEGVAVQRLLARGRSATEWEQAVERFGNAFKLYFNNELPDMRASVGNMADASAGGFSLRQPWPMGARVVHLAYFDHVYPMVDTGSDGNSMVVTYLGHGSVQYNGHDGHDYVFPDLPVGTPILAAAPGMAYARTHRGNGVVIRHAGGYETVYWHLDAFATLFEGRIDGGEGVWVDTGTVLGTSGTSGFTRGTPHLHFEVRHYGRQVDPYGWYGPGPDPCLAYAGCAPSSWLWDAGLAGSYDFTPPDTALPPQDTRPPIATLAVAPPDDLLLLAHFDGHVLQTVGKGFPGLDGAVTFEEGRYGEALRPSSEGGLTFPVSENMRLEAGTLSLWVRLPERYPASTIRRHYLFAASAAAFDETRTYTGTFALRREEHDTGARWNFWTVAQSGAAGRHDLTAPDTLAPGWRHIAVTWDAPRGFKALYLDGIPAAYATGVTLPVEIGPLLQFGRFTYGGRQSGVSFDELAIYGRALEDVEIAALAGSTMPIEDGRTVLRTPSFLLDTNAGDDEGGVVAVQIGRDGIFGDPQAYYDGYRWRLPAVEGEYTLAVRYFDRAGNTTTVSRTVQLDLPPQAQVQVSGESSSSVTLAVSVAYAEGSVEMQVSEWADFAGADWAPLSRLIEHNWPTGRRLFIRLRDASGAIGEAVVVAAGGRAYLPMVRAGLAGQTLP